MRHIGSTAIRPVEHSKPLHLFVVEELHISRSRNLPTMLLFPVTTVQHYSHHLTDAPNVELHNDHHVILEVLHKILKSTSTQRRILSFLGQH